MCWHWQERTGSRRSFHPWRRPRCRLGQGTPFWPQPGGCSCSPSPSPPPRRSLHCPPERERKETPAWGEKQTGWEEIKSRSERGKLIIRRWISYCVVLKRYFRFFTVEFCGKVVNSYYLTCWTLGPQFGQTELSVELQTKRGQSGANQVDRCHLQKIINIS